MLQSLGWSLMITRKKCSAVKVQHAAGLVLTKILVSVLCVGMRWKNAG